MRLFCHLAHVLAVYIFRLEGSLLRFYAFAVFLQARHARAHFFLRATQVGGLRDILFTPETCLKLCALFLSCSNASWWTERHPAQPIYIVFSFARSFFLIATQVGGLRDTLFSPDTIFSLRALFFLRAKQGCGLLDILFSPDTICSLRALF